MVYGLQFTVYSFLRSVGAQAGKLGVWFTVYGLQFSWRAELGIHFYALNIKQYTN